MLYLFPISSVNLFLILFEMDRLTDFQAKSQENEKVRKKNLKNLKNLKNAWKCFEKEFQSFENENENESEKWNWKWKD